MPSARGALVLTSECWGVQWLNIGMEQLSTKNCVCRRSRYAPPAVRVQGNGYAVPVNVKRLPMHTRSMDEDRREELRRRMQRLDLLTCASLLMHTSADLLILVFAHRTVPGQSFELLRGWAHARSFM